MTLPSESRTRRSPPAASQLRLGFDFDESEAAAAFRSRQEFEAVVSKVFGRSPAGADTRRPLHLSWIETPIGSLIAATHTGRLVLLEYTDPRRMQIQAEALKSRFKAPFVPEDDDVIRRTRRELDEYFGGKRHEFSVPLDYPGTPFETRVWNELLDIPFGETRSYEELAERVSSKAAVRAVGSANGRNRISILIPCHRVVNKSGALGGYGGGLWRKQALLLLEHRGAIRQAE